MTQIFQKMLSLLHETLSYPHKKIQENMLITAGVMSNRMSDIEDTLKIGL